MTASTICSLDTDHRLEEIIDLNMRVHNIDRAFCERMLLLNPDSNSPEFHRFLVEDGRIISGVSLFEHKLSWFGSTIEVGEIGIVGTLEEYRRKGHASRLMNDWIDIMREGKTPLSFLWGIPDFYQKFHFYYAYPNHSTPYVSLPKSCTEGWEPSGEIRHAEVPDQWWIKKLYRAYNAGMNGWHLRSDDLWDWYFRITCDTTGELVDGVGTHQWWVSEDPMGGYAFIAGGPLRPIRLWEIAAASPNSLRILILGLFNAYPKLESLDLCHHPDMPVGKWLYQWGARISSPEDIWKGTWGGMVRLMDPLALLQLMTGTLNDRLTQSRFFNFTGTIAFDSEVGGAEIRISDGQVDVSPLTGNASIQIPARVLTPIMTGYRGFERFRSELRDIPDRTADLLSILFTRDKVFMYPLLYADEAFALRK